eukprot:492284_1
MGSGHLSANVRTIETAYPLLRGSILQHEPEYEESRAANSIPSFHYGTAGFRCAADQLKTVMHRMGMLAALRSRVLGGLVTGLVVTASHNTAPDNGVKLVDPNGGMLDSSWEYFAEDLANAASSDGVLEALANIYLELELNQPGATGAQKDNVVCGVDDAQVFVARDTRPSGEYLAELALAGIRSLNAQATDFGIMTTPQLHHCVWAHNRATSVPERWKSEAGYYEMLAEGFSDLIEARTESSGSRTSSYWMGQKDSSKSGIGFPLIVDGACGVGGMKLVKLLDRIKSRCKKFEIEIRNMPSVEHPEDLNKGCGAEHAQKLQLPPHGFSNENTKLHWCCSLDGDADRLVYHFFSPDGQWHLLDGDRIAVLLASFIGEELVQLPPGFANKVCVVQTAYANGSSTAYLKEKGLEVELAKTGVKYLHPKAAVHDVGAYFEANGHGTVLFKECFQTMLSEAVARLGHKGGDENSNSEDRKNPTREEIALRRLAAFCKLANQAVGDALSDLLLVEAVLLLRGWDVVDWLSMYNDLPSCQAKLVVRDRMALRCAGEGECDETRLAEPPALQAEIDAAVAALGSHMQPRCFVRASGTEDLVRVYAEAATQAAANGLALSALQAVHKHAGGVSSPPVAIR